MYGFRGTFDRNDDTNITNPLQVIYASAPSLKNVSNAADECGTVQFGFLIYRCATNASSTIGQLTYNAMRSVQSYLTNGTRLPVPGRTFHGFSQSVPPVTTPEPSWAIPTTCVAHGPALTDAGPTSAMPTPSRWHRSSR